ncbi:MAG: phage major capsid protein [Pyrinomonadaceae bacterium MAG19_C2-C3]|nr:phage major capsid protein [Pyrinomonadaceae bacterium MAG19_C2-C3]
MTTENRQATDIIGQPLVRSFLMRAEKETVDTDARTVELSFSSDAPVEHWFGKLILDHSPKCVRQERIKDGAPLLIDHNRSLQIGVLEDVRFTEGKGRTRARFSRRPMAEGELQDIADGIRTKISVGFFVHKMELVETDDKEGDTYRATNWEPFEVSIVSIPADTSVGVGRELQTKDDFEARLNEARTHYVETTTTPTEVRTRTVKDEDKTNTANVPATVAANPADNQGAMTPAMSEAREILALGEMTGDTDFARNHIASGTSLADFRKALQTERAAKQAAITQAPVVDLSAKEQKQYSIARAILADADQRDGKRTSSFELEVSEEIEKKLPGHIKRHGGIFIPTSMNRAGLDSKTDTKGQELVFTEQGDFISRLYARSVLMNLGVTKLAGLQGNVAFPKQIGSAQLFWVGENPGVDVPESSLMLDQVLLSPKTAQSTTSFSRQLLRQSAMDTDGLVKDDLAKVAALGIDLAGLHGAGGLAPTGIFNQAGVGVVDFENGPITFAKVVEMETEISESNASDLGSMAYVTTVPVLGRAKTTQMFAATNGMPLLAGGEINGYPAVASTQVRRDLGVGTNEHAIAFGVWSEMLFGEWGAMEIITDPYRLKKQGMIEVTNFMMVDMAIRHAEAFVKGIKLQNA